MSVDEKQRNLDSAGPAAPPRSNGELVFAAPWESRVFGLAMALHEQGLFEWEEFRQRLIAEVASWEREHLGDASYSYYARWQAALERLLADKGLCRAVEIEEREHRLAERPVGHDH